MNKSLRTRRIAIVGLLAVIVASCASPGPLSLSLRLSQARSGDNRSIASTVSKAEESLYSEVDYTVMNDLSVDRISGFAWSIVQQPKAKEAFRQMADAFGVVGDVVKTEKNSYTIGFDSATGTGMWLWVDIAGAWWSYQASGVKDSTVSSCAPDAPTCPSGSVDIPKNLLTSREALNRTASIMTRGGYNPAAFQMKATTSQWSTDVTGVMAVAGVPSNLSVYFSYGENGTLTSGSGPLLKIKRANGYYLVDPTEAVSRLKDARYTTWGNVTRSTVDIALSSTKPAMESSMASVQSLVVPITGVRYVLMQAALTNNASILVPAYTYFNNDGDIGTVLAMKDENLIFNEPSIAINTVAPPEPVNTDGSNEGGASPGLDPSINVLNEENAKSLIGLTEEEAAKIATERGWVIRVAMRDGEALMLTMDYVASRVNLTVVKTIVTAVTVG